MHSKRERKRGDVLVFSSVLVYRVSHMCDPAMTVVLAHVCGFERVKTLQFGVLVRVSLRSLVRGSVV